MASVIQPGGAELLGPEGGSVFVMTEPPYTEGVRDPEQHGPLFCAFERNAGRPIPPDS